MDRIDSSLPHSVNIIVICTFHLESGDIVVNLVVQLRIVVDSADGPVFSFFICPQILLIQDLFGQLKVLVFCFLTLGFNLFLDVVCQNLFDVECFLRFLLVVVSVQNQFDLSFGSSELLECIFDWFLESQGVDRELVDGVAIVRLLFGVGQEFLGERFLLAFKLGSAFVELVAALVELTVDQVDFVDQLEHGVFLELLVHRFPEARLLNFFNVFIDLLLVTLVQHFELRSIRHPKQFLFSGFV
mmetsp:Transcript_16594/g.36491  ORF Transcript_16594/g.36491 Transcript_16594/m.36491 type:complete len:243 (-) Transcript_16594:8-736(-)